MHELSDRIRNEWRAEKKTKRSARLEELFVAIDVVGEGAITIDDLHVLASACTATGREISMVWTEDKLKSGEFSCCHAHMPHTQRLTPPGLTLT